VAPKLPENSLHPVLSRSPCRSNCFERASTGAPSDRTRGSTPLFEYPSRQPDGIWRGLNRNDRWQARRTYHARSYASPSTRPAGYHTSPAVTVSNPRSAPRGARRTVGGIRALADNSGCRTSWQSTLLRSQAALYTSGQLFDSRLRGVFWLRVCSRPGRGGPRSQCEGRPLR
jgi:hypothetical protein